MQPFFFKVHDCSKLKFYFIHSCDILLGKRTLWRWCSKHASFRIVLHKYFITQTYTKCLGKGKRKDRKIGTLFVLFITVHSCTRHKEITIDIVKHLSCTGNISMWQKIGKCNALALVSVCSSTRAVQYGWVKWNKKGLKCTTLHSSLQFIIIHSCIKRDSMQVFNTLENQKSCILMSSPKNQQFHWA